MEVGSTVSGLGAPLTTIVDIVAAGAAPDGALAAGVAGAAAGGAGVVVVFVVVCAKPGVGQVVINAKVHAVNR